MRILITGAFGNFGSWAVRLLLETVPAEDLVLMSRTPDRLEKFATLGCAVRYGDFDAVPWTVLRDGMYANSIADAAYPAALSTGRWVSCAGDGRLSLIDRDDCIACAVAVLVSEGHEDTLYNVVGTELWRWPSSRLR
jgi:uncharacterized protein YbjT (DUF2867 family)